MHYCSYWSHTSRCYHYMVSTFWTAFDWETGLSHEEVKYTSDGLIKLGEWREILKVIFRFIQVAVWSDGVNTLETAELIVLSTPPTEVLWHTLYLDTLCIVLCIVCVHCFTEQGWLILLCPPQTLSFVISEGVWVFSWHHSYPPLHLPPSDPSSPSPFFSLICLSVLFKPSVSVGPSPSPSRLP